LPERLLPLPPGVTAERAERVVVRDLSSVPPEQLSSERWRAAVTDAPDGTRWVGLLPGRATNGPAASEEARGGCEELLAWGASRGATRAYVELGDDDTEPADLAGALGFRLHHRRRYVRIADSV
jgi:hypothetical protein